MLVSHRYKFVYLRPPRTASGAISKTLIEKYEAKVVSFEDAGHKTEWMPEFAGYYTFIVTRNPFPRMISLWKRAMEHDPDRDPDVQEIMGHDRSFQDWVLDGRVQQWLLNKSCHYYTEDVPAIHRVIAHERLWLEVHSLPFVKGPLAVGVRIHESNYQRPWWEEYDDYAIQKVRELWADDFQAFDYRMTFEDSLP